MFAMIHILNIVEFLHENKLTKKKVYLQFIRIFKLFFFFNSSLFLLTPNYLIFYINTFGAIVIKYCPYGSSVDTGCK